MKKAILLASALLTFVSMSAQRQKHVGIEVFGPTNLVGLSYEQPLGKNSPFAVRAGLSYGYSSTTGFAIGATDDGLFDIYPYDSHSNQFAVPVEINILTRRLKHNHLEGALGASFGLYHDTYQFDLEPATVNVTQNNFGYFCFASLGWRHDFRSPLTLRLGATLTFDFGGSHAASRESSIAPYVGLAYRF